jgi:hypothetical protein
VSDRLRLIGYGCLPKSPQTSEHPRAPADCPPVGWRLRAPHYGALTIGRPRSANDLQRCLPLCGQSRHSFPQPTNLNYQQEAWAWGIVVEITAALLGGFACGYVVRELVSRQRRAAEKRRYLERQAVAKRQLLQKKILARQVTVKRAGYRRGRENSLIPRHASEQGSRKKLETQVSEMRQEHSKKPKRVVRPRSAARSHCSPSVTTTAAPWAAPSSLCERR